MIPLPSIQQAVQLTGPDRLEMNFAKPVHCPGPYQFLSRIEVVGLCFSDLKLLKQFSRHVRKSPILDGIDPAVLAEYPGYAPGDAPTVPGHEVVLTVLEIGAHVTVVQPGQRYVVQADYRWLRTADSNAAFGYNLEGGLQEFVLLDERIIRSPSDELMLLPVADHLSASAAALVEPWACVENSYVSRERCELLEGGTCLVCVAPNAKADALAAFFDHQPTPRKLLWLGAQAPSSLMGRAVFVTDPFALAPESVTDLCYVGANAELLEALWPAVAPKALILIATAGASFGRAVTLPVGRIHYGGLRFSGTTSANPTDAVANIPVNGELRPKERVQIIGAGGPMGAMHVIRNLSAGMPGLELYAADLSDDRLAGLARIAGPLACERGVGYHSYNSNVQRLDVVCSYIVIMAPVPALIAEAVADIAPRGIINIFAGVPATVSHPVDLDRFCAKGLFFIGTSGSTIEDMRAVLAKVTAGTLDTNLSVAAVSGLDGALDGLAAVAAQSIPGKIMIYPQCRGLGLSPLDQLAAVRPSVAAHLRDGCWTRAAEQSLIS